MARVGELARRRNAYLISAAIAWPIVIAVILADPVALSADWPLWARITISVVFGPVIIFGAVLAPLVALFAQAEVRALQRLMTREDEVVARWTVSPAAWQAFLAAEARLGKAGVVDQIDKAMVVPAAGIACVAGADGVLIGSDFCKISGMGIVSRIAAAANPGVIQVDALMPRGRFGGFTTNRLRFPIPYGSKPARDVQTAWLHRCGLIGNADALGNPLRRRNLALLGLGAGMALIAVPIMRHGYTAIFERDEGGIEALLMVPGIFLTAFGLGLALRFQMDSRRSAAASRGRGAIGRWHVAPAIWQAFQQQEATRRQQDEPWNLAPVTMFATRGVAVIATEDGVSIAGSFFHFPSFSADRLTAARWVVGSPDCIELTGIYHARVGAFSRLSAPSGDRGAFTLRFPVAPGAEAAAQQALRQWQTRFLGR